jgi:hypothetical protein
MTEFNFGWSPEIEARDTEQVFNGTYAGETWYVDWSTIKSKIYDEAKRHTSRIPTAADDYPYLQNASSACTAINSGWGVFATLSVSARNGKEVEVVRPFEAYHYMLYHAYIARDFGYGGCSLAGMMKVFNEYGILPYKDSGYSSPISDNEMVRLGWNRRGTAETVAKKFQPVSENWQIKATVPKSAEDVRACLKAGYAVPYGTTLAMKKSGDTYQASGRTAHCMAFAPFFESDDVLYHRNDYGDGLGKMTMKTLETQIRNGIQMFCILDVERTAMKTKPNWEIL